MNNPTSTSPGRGHPTCEVCGQALSHAQAMKLKGKDYSVCDAFDCNRLINQRALMAPAQFRWQLDFQRNLLQQRRRQQAEEKQRIDALSALHKQQEQAVLQRLLTRHAHLDAGVQTVVIPRGLATVTPLSESRIENYLQHLRAIIAEAASYASIEEVVHDQHYAARHKLAELDARFADHPELRNISDQLCTLCKGGCCISGKDHAYLSAFSMRQQMEQNPGWSQDDLLERYRRLISAQTMEGSCINHTPDGCALPRELRSNICNAFYCDALKTYQKANPQGQPQDMLVIQRAAACSSAINPDLDNAITRVVYMQQNALCELPDSFAQGATDENTETADP